MAVPTPAAMPRSSPINARDHSLGSRRLSSASAPPDEQPDRRSALDDLGRAVHDARGLISRTLEKRRLRVFVIAAGCFITLLIGVSRMYLGVHYPTDVLAGWTAGLIWALVCGLIVRKLGKKGAVPTPHAEGDTEAGGDTSVESDQSK